MLWIRSLSIRHESGDHREPAGVAEMNSSRDSFREPLVIPSGGEPVWRRDEGKRPRVLQRGEVDALEGDEERKRQSETGQ